MIALQVNPSLKNYLNTHGFSSLEIYPINAYSDSTAPFITWFEYPGSRSIEQYWLRQSTLTYYVYDNDISRAKDVVIAMEKFLHVGDDVMPIANTAPIASPIYRLRWSRLLNGSMFPALEREGFSSITRSFDVGYIEL